MTQVPARFVAITISLVLFTACTSVRPRVSRGGTDQPTSILPGSLSGPRPGPEPAIDGNAKPIIDEICRASGMRAGWLAIRYVQGGANCPANTDPGNPYTASVIERYDQKPVGAEMVVCADQTIPHQWVRTTSQHVQTTCPGARVRDGSPTVMVIRRVSQRS